MRVTLTLPEELLQELEARGYINDERRSLVAEAALRYALDNSEDWQHDFYALLMEAREDRHGGHREFQPKKRKTKPLR